MWDAAAAWLAAEAQRRQPARALGVTALAMLALGFPLALLQSDAHHQPFAGYGALAWALFQYWYASPLPFVLGFGILNDTEEHIDHLETQSELIAQLDQTDYALQVRAAEAELTQARQHLQRQENLYRHNAVSASVLEAARTDAELAATQLESARQELAYTSLYAPFDALIARRLVENHTTLPPNAEVVRIQDISELRIRINVPEALMQHLDGEHGFNAEAEIATLPGERIALEYREHITEPDEVAQTYQVEFAPAQGEHLVALPGTTATVFIEPAERLVSGPGLELTYRALAAEAGASTPALVSRSSFSTRGRSRKTKVR